jgi:hypothetical protein
LWIDTLDSPFFFPFSKGCAPFYLRFRPITKKKRKEEEAALV